jgi:hypothetical protein
MKTQKSMPEEVAEVFDKLKSEIIWLHGRWIIFEQLYGTSPERVELLNEIASSYFRITQDALLDGILIYIGRITAGLSLKKMSKSEIGQVHWGDENSPHNPGSHLRCAIVDVRIT